MRARVDLRVGVLGTLQTALAASRGAASGRLDARGPSALTRRAPSAAPAARQPATSAGNLTGTAPSSELVVEPGDEQGVGDLDVGLRGVLQARTSDDGVHVEGADVQPVVPGGGGGYASTPRPSATDDPRRGRIGLAVG